jgi:two-component system phosphate regulon sensor histidine kinase PhoR
MAGEGQAMWRSRLFWRLFGGYSLLLVASLALLSWALVRQIERRLLDNTRESLHREVIVLRETLRSRPAGDLTPQALQPLAQQLARQTNTRVTFFRDNGTLLADSEPSAGPLESQANAKEIVEATTEKPGTDTRGGPGQAQETLYVALRTESLAGTLIVRLGVSLASVREDVAWLRRLFWGGAALTLLPALAGCLWIARRQSAPILELASAARAMAQGEPAERVAVPGGGEMRVLASALNVMSDERARSIAQMEQDREQLRGVFRSMLEGVAVVDAEQRIILINEAACDVLNVAVANARGRRLWELVRHRQLAEKLDEVLAGAGPQRFELEWRFPANRILAVQVSALPGEALTGAVLVFTDITRVRRLERYRQEFVANASHEMKTPLAAIQATVETLLDGALQDPEHNVRFLRRISENAERLSRLILDLLTLGRLESGQESLDIEPLALGEAIEACFRRHEHAARGKGLRLEKSPPGQAIAVHADAEALDQILDNLATNAIKYTPSGGRVALRWFAEGSSVCVQVEDTGEGISERDLPRIFERFYRVDKARSRELGGTGLGLSIVKHLCQALGGSVSAASELGVGSTFTVRLPRAELPAAVPASA